MSVGTSAALIGGGLAAVGTVAGSVIGADAQGAAGRTAEQGQRDAMAQQERLARESIAYQERQSGAQMDFLRQQYNDARTQLQPYNDIQMRATKGLEAFSDPNNPIYGQQRQQMTQNIQQQLAAQGLLRSREQVDDLGQIELGLNQQRLGVQQGLAGLGAAQGLAGLAQDYGAQGGAAIGNLGQQVGSALGNLGSQNAQGIQSLSQLNAQRQLAQGQGTQGMISGLTNVFGNTLGGINSQNQNQMMLALLGRQAGFQTGTDMNNFIKGFSMTGNQK